MVSFLKNASRRYPVPVSVVHFQYSCILHFRSGCLNAVIFPVFFNNQTHLAENEGNLSVYFLDVGQGDSTLFVVDGKTILIDAGEMEMGDRVVSDLENTGRHTDRSPGCHAPAFRPYRRDAEGPRGIPGWTGAGFRASSPITSL